MTQPPDAPDYDLTAERLRLLAHPERLWILDALRREAECVCHLEALLGKSQPYVSRHLRLLRDGGLIADERRGQNVYYRLASETVAVWLETILGPAQGEMAAMAQHKRLISCACPKCAEPTARHPLILVA
jgi:ArsR family transcriptional regulator